MQANAAPSVSTTADLQSGTLYNRLKDKWPKLTSQQAEAYLKANHRSLASRQTNQAVQELVSASGLANFTFRYR
jgi:hypothetical protein